MRTYVVLFRGVMPVGKNRVPMVKLREVLTKAGFKKVRTYIASGNALVDTELSPKEVEIRVHNLIKKHIGPDLVVVVRTGAQLQKMLDANPFKRDHAISRVFFMSFEKTPSSQKVGELVKQNFSPEEIVFSGNTATVYIPGPYVKGKLAANNLEKLLGVSGTMRNVNTVTRLIAMSQE